jgi:anaerobic selenocysteine-containing dehydrogenase
MGKAKLIFIDGGAPRQSPAGYPFRLIQRPSLFQSGLLSLRSDALKRVSEKSYLGMNLEDGHRLGIEDGEVVQVSTDQGRSLQIKVKYSPRLVPGVATCPYPFPLMDEGDIVSIKVESLKKGGN